MTYETETSLDQTASPSAKVVKKVWRRPELDHVQIPSTGNEYCYEDDGASLGGTIPVSGCG